MKYFLLFALVLLMGAGCAQDKVVITEVDSLTFPERQEFPVYEEELEDNGEVLGATELSLGVGEDEVEAEEQEGVVSSPPHEMVSGNFFFEPDRIYVKAGEEVEIRFLEVNGVHTFAIDEIQVKFPVKEGETIRFTAPTEPGAYPFYSDIGQHRFLGMHGVLFVE